MPTLTMRSVLAILVLGAAACSSGSGGPPVPVTMAQRYPIDGIADLDAMANVHTVTVTMRDQGGTGAVVGTSTLRWAVDNDDRDLYLALQWTDPTFDHAWDPALGPTDYDAVVVQFDASGDGTFRDGEDQRMVFTAGPGSYYLDQHKSSGDGTDVIGDGSARLRHDAATGTYTAEFLLPMADDANGEDGVLSAGSRLNFVLFDAFTLSPGNNGFAYGSGNDSSSWPLLPLVAPTGTFAHATIPAGLTGLLAFISSHEEPAGEVYTFDPSTGVVTRVTHLPDLYKENVSLSHDRTRLAFHGVAFDHLTHTVAEARADFQHYEVYRIDVSGQDSGNSPTTASSTVTRPGHPTTSASRSPRSAKALAPPPWC